MATDRAWATLDSRCSPPTRLRPPALPQRRTHASSKTLRNRTHTKAVKSRWNIDGAVGVATRLCARGVRNSTGGNLPPGPEKSTCRKTDGGVSRTIVPLTGFLKMDFGWLTQHADDVGSGDDEGLLCLEVPDQNRRIFRRNHRRQQLDGRRYIHKREGGQHDGFDPLVLAVLVAHHLVIEVRFVQGPDDAPAAGDRELGKVVVAHDADGILHRTGRLDRVELP